MSKILRHATYEMVGEGGQSLRLKKWSTAKLFLLVRDIGSILEESFDGLLLDKISEVQLITRLVISLCRSEKRAVRLIRETLEEPKLTEKEILGWDPEDFLGCLRAVFELNLTKDLSKNFEGLLGLIGNQSPAGMKKSEKPLTEASQ